MNAHKSKLLFRPSGLSVHLFLSGVLIPPPLGFLTTFFVQNLNFSKSFHVNPKLEYTMLFWICKMTNKRRFYNCTFTLLNRESVYTSRVLIPPPLACLGLKPKVFKNVHKSYLHACMMLITNFNVLFLVLDSFIDIYSLRIQDLSCKLGKFTA